MKCPNCKKDVKSFSVISGKCIYCKTDKDRETTLKLLSGLNKIANKELNKRG